MGRGRTVEVEGWSFRLSEGLTLIAGGQTHHASTTVCVFRQSEKVAQFRLEARGRDQQLHVQAVSSDVVLEVSSCEQLVTIVEKG